MTNTQKLELWLQNAVEDKDVVAELKALQESNDVAEIEERFYRDLEFGTGGLRGVIGAGTNRMNIYTVRQATQGLAAYILASGNASKVAIGYDSRIKSDVFAQQAAQVLAANGIKVYLYPRLMPTPALSFAVRHLGCGGGICVTASHNPAKYNGYKVYGADGGQITTEAAQQVLAEIEKVDIFADVKSISFKEALDANTIEYIGEDVVDAYLAAVKNEQVTQGLNAKLRVVYTPLNGAGLECVTRILGMTGIEDVQVVPEQKDPDGNFPTAPYPNPEIREAMQKGLELSALVKPDLLLATDPDCDRVGIAVPKDDEYVLVSGNEVGCLLLDYICKARIANGKMPQNPVAVKTIVTTDMADAIAKKYNVELRNVLTGFKFIGEQIGLLEQKDEAHRYILGFEESYGYLSGGYVRDKDAVNASMLICEMARYYKEQNKTLAEVLEELYKEHGYYQNSLLSFTFEGKAGLEEMKKLMSEVRGSHPDSIEEMKIVGSYDYLIGVAKGDAVQADLPQADVLEFHLEGYNKLIIRPSGTEPKLKVYFSVRGQDKAEADRKTFALHQYAERIFGTPG